jgi:hypothetical protein
MVIIKSKKKFLISVTGFAEALEPNRRKEENATNLFLNAASMTKFESRAYSAPFILLGLFF